MRLGKKGVCELTHEEQCGETQCKWKPHAQEKTCWKQDALEECQVFMIFNSGFQEVILEI